jgi:hypothetical protein
MKFMRTKFLYCLIVTASIVSVIEVKAQRNTLYYMTSVPQVYFLNPAIQPDCNFFFGMPLGSSTQFDVSNNAITFNDIFYKDTANKVVGFSQTTAGIDKFISKLDKVNYFSMGEDQTLFSMGFRSNRMYFTLDLSSHFNSRIDYPKDLLNFLSFNIPSGSHFDMSSMNIDITEYFEIGLGISRRFGDQLTVGIRPKLLYGIATLSSNTHDFSINSDPITKDLTININSELNVCTPGILVPTNADGVIDWNGDFKFDSTLKSTSDYSKLATGNKGYGIDIGLNYSPFERLELSASLLDLGYIKWRNYTHTFTVNGSYLYDGLLVDFKDSTDAFQNFADSLKSHFEFKGTEKEFTTNLTPKLFVGGRFFVIPSFDLGALGRFDFYKNDTKSNIILLANWRPIRIWNVSASYGLLDGSYSTFGLGMSFKLGPSNFYIASDDIPTTYNLIKYKSNNYPVPNGMLSYNIRFGFNLVIGSQMKKKRLNDKPMYISSEY